MATPLDAETARGIAQRIVREPLLPHREDVPAADVEGRGSSPDLRSEGKPEAALPKIVEGRVTAYFKQVALLEQDYARDNKVCGAGAKEAGLTVTDFARFKVGA